MISHMISHTTATAASHKHLQFKILYVEFSEVPFNNSWFHSFPLWVVHVLLKKSVMTLPSLGYVICSPNSCLKHNSVADNAELWYAVTPFSKNPSHRYGGCYMHVTVWPLLLHFSLSCWQEV